MATCWNSMAPSGLATCRVGDVKVRQCNRPGRRPATSSTDRDRAGSPSAIGTVPVQGEPIIGEQVLKGADPRCGRRPVRARARSSNPGSRDRWPPPRTAGQSSTKTHSRGARPSPSLPARYVRGSGLRQPSTAEMTYVREERADRAGGRDPPARPVADDRHEHTAIAQALQNGSDLRERLDRRVGGRSFQLGQQRGGGSPDAERRQDGHVVVGAAGRRRTASSTRCPASSTRCPASKARGTTRPRCRGRTAARSPRSRTAGSTGHRPGGSTCHPRQNRTPRTPIRGSVRKGPGPALSGGEELPHDQGRVGPGRRIVRGVAGGRRSTGPGVPATIDRVEQHLGAAGTR